MHKPFPRGRSIILPNLHCVFLYFSLQNLAVLVFAETEGEADFI
jgi:hypothetical protein